MHTFPDTRTVPASGLVASPTPRPHDHLAEMLARFGIPALRAGQRHAFDAVARNEDVLVILPTGGGKSLCYQMPAACGVAPTIVVSPLVALMKDQVESLHRRGIPAAQLSGAVPARERDAAWSLLAEQRLTLLYVAPEALASPRTRARLAAAVPRLLAVDEAHCISEWGESFRPSYLTLGDVRLALGRPPTIALTATATPRTARDIVTRLALRDPVVVRGGFDRRNLRLHVREVAGDAERLTLLEAIAGHLPGAAVCYASSRRQAERLAATFRRRGVAAAPFHAGLSTAERGKLQDDFQANRLAMIVATNAFGMGVDKPDVRLVVHAAPPLTLEAYYQEAGRGGRDGAPADCVLLLAPNDLSRTRHRLAPGVVSAPLLRHLLALLGSGAARALRAREAGAATARLARALGCAPAPVEAALRLLVEAGVIGVAHGGGHLRLIATSERLQDGRSLDPRDAHAIERLTRAAGAALGSRGEQGPGAAAAGAIGTRGAGSAIGWAALRRHAPDGDVRAFVARLEARQLAVWCAHDAPWHVLRDATDATLDELVRRHQTRQARDRWRFEQVARMVTTPRCRRTVLLRYFGDAAPDAPCGACDRCGMAR